MIISGDVDSAITVYSQAMEKGMVAPELFKARGVAYSIQSDWKKAEKDFSQAISKNKTDASCWAHRAEVRWNQKNWAGVASDLVKALELDPHQSLATFYASLSELRTRKWDQALKTSLAGLDKHPRHAGLHATAGFALLQQRNHQKASVYFSRASQLRSNYAFAWWGMGVSLQKLGKTLESTDYLKIACQLSASACKRTISLDSALALIPLFAQERYPGLCMCCRLFGQDNRHQEEKVKKLLADRGDQQREKTKQLGAFHDFELEDRYFETGFTFANRVVEDSAREWKPVHYDHGNGLALADVDGDGRLDFYFTTQLGANRLVRSLGKGRYEDITANSGVAMENKISVSAAFADADNDGDPDLLVTTVRKGIYFFENLGNGRFNDRSKAAGLSSQEHNSAPLFFDFDNDGLLDILITNVGVYTNEEKQPAGNYVGLLDAFSGHLKPDRYEKSRLYRNQGKLKFKDVTEAMGFSDVGFAGDATIVDINNDGYQDLYVLNMQGDDHFYINEKGKRLVEKTATYFPKTPWGSMGVKFFDYNNNGRPDVYITDMHSDMSANVYPHQEKDKSVMTWSDQFLQDGSNNVFGNGFYRNSGSGAFREMSDLSGLENYWPWGLSAGDLNADGYLDLFVTASMNYPFRYGVNSLFLNDGGRKFHDAEFLLGAEPREQTVKPWFVMDCDGEDKENSLCKNQKGKVLVWGAYGSRASAFVDIDDDGDLDIVTNDFNSHPLVLVSNLTKKTNVHFLKIELEGSKSNRNGLGAKVTIRANGETYTQFQDGKSGYLSQSVMPLYFGLGKANSVSEIVVSWPSGVLQTIKGPIPVNQTLKILEKASAN